MSKKVITPPPTHFLMCFLSEMEWIKSEMLLPGHLSIHGVFAAQTTWTMKKNEDKNQCHQFLPQSDNKNSPPYYHPKFWCTARAICVGPGDTILGVFTNDQKIFVLQTNSFQSVENTDLCMMIQFRCTAKTPFVIHRDTPLENIVIHPDMQPCSVVVNQNFINNLREKYQTFLRPPTPVTFDMMKMMNNNNNNEGDGQQLEEEEEEAKEEEEEEEEKEVKKEVEEEDEEKEFREEEEEEGEEEEDTEQMYEGE